MSTRIARRAMVKLIAAAAAAPALLAACATAPGDAAASAAAARALARHPSAGPAGTLTDPNLVHPIVPWQLTLDQQQRHTLAVLCDLIVPADERSPAASTLGAHDFIDEWVSAPYEAMQKDAGVVREGLAWLDAEAGRRFGVAFTLLQPAQQATICEAICDLRAVAPELQQAAYFVDRVRELTVISHYTTRAGRDDLGYVGNVPLTEWAAPPAEVLRHVGLE